MPRYKYLKDDELASLARRTVKRKKHTQRKVAELVGLEFCEATQTKISQALAGVNRKWLMRILRAYYPKWRFDDGYTRVVKRIPRKLPASWKEPQYDGITGEDDMIARATENKHKTNEE